MHGCFWHRHTCKYGKVMPATRKEFWQKKLEGNKQRDRLNERQLKKMGWEVAVVWECEIRDMIKLESRLVKFLRA